MKENCNQDFIAFIGRVLVTSLFLISAYGKIAAPAGTIGYIAAVGLPLPTLGYGVALIVEIALSIALLLGVKTRLAAALLALYSVVTALVFHLHFSDQDQLFHFFKDIAIAGGLLQLVAFGGGRLGIDGRGRARIRENG